MSKKQLPIIHANSIVKYLNTMHLGEEYVIPSGTKGHCLYVTLHKFSDSEILVRIDNKLLSGGIDSTIHNRHPYTIDVKEFFWESYNAQGVKLDTPIEVPCTNTKIKSYPLALINLNNADEVEALSLYISKILITETKEFSYIYGASLPNKVKLAYDTMPDMIKAYVDSWPYHYIQETATNNCTLSSYSLGISVRHGIDFFEWLTAKEEGLLPHTTRIEERYHNIPQQPYNKS